MIGSIDQYFVDSHYKNDDYIKMKKQQIENMNKAEMIEQVRPFNKKWWYLNEIYSIILMINLVCVYVSHVSVVSIKYCAFYANIFKISTWKDVFPKEVLSKSYKDIFVLATATSGGNFL